MENSIKDLKMTQAQSIIQMIELSRLTVSNLNPRKKANDIRELAETIKSSSIIQPLIVRPIGDNRFEVIVGSRRLAAANEAGLKEVPCLVRENLADNEARILSLTENLQRKDITPLERAKGIQELLNRDHSLTYDDIAKKFGVTKGRISQWLALLKYPEELKKLIDQGSLTLEHGRILIMAFSQLNDFPLREWIKRTRRKRWSVNQLHIHINENA